MKTTIINGDSAEKLKDYPDNHFDAIVTDPPYGIEFLSKDWDKNTGAVEVWTECLRVLKPGGYLLAFSAARTYHHLAINIEQVGFEIKDQLMWLYASGFPKAQDVGRMIQKHLGVEEKKEGEKYKTIQKKEVVLTDQEAQQWEGWKTALKPAHEPIIMARKPMKQSTATNVLEHGTGALNIDGSRIPYDQDDTPSAGIRTFDPYDFEQKVEKGIKNAPKPMNASATKGFRKYMDKHEHGEENEYEGGYEPSPIGRYPSNVIGEVKGYEKYFFCPKVSRNERHIGLEIPDQGIQKLNGEKTSNKGNNHPTVKPVELMKYLVKLVTPPNRKVLDPFMGSGSTGMACVELGFEFTGIDLDENYCAIAERRINMWSDLQDANKVAKMEMIKKVEKANAVEFEDAFEDFFKKD